MTCGLVLACVGAGCGGSDAIEVTLAAGGRTDNRASVTTSIDGVQKTHANVALPYVETIALGGSFDLSIEVTSLDGNDVRCEISGLDEGHDIPINPDLGSGDSVQLGGPVRSEDGPRVRCSVEGTIHDDSLSYSSDADVLG